MEKAGGGAIVNISSISGKVGVVTEVAYCASKFGVTGLTIAPPPAFSIYGITALIAKNTEC